MSDQPMNRRRFASCLAAGSVGLTVTAEFVRADHSAKNEKDTDPQPADLKPKAASDTSKPELDAAKPQPVSEDEHHKEPPEEAYLLGLLLKRYPDDRLTDKAISDIVNDIRSDLARSRMLSAFPLKNSDQPGAVFRAYRGRE